MHSPSHDAPYRQIFEQAGSGLARLSLEGRFLEVNPRFALIAGRHAIDLVGLLARDLVHPDDWPLAQAQMEIAQVAGAPSPGSVELRCVRPDGHVVWVALNLSVWRDEAGQARQFVAVAEDIGHRRQTQEAMSAAQAAERASKAKTEFLSRMSHELRTPLNAMLGFAQLLRVDPRYPLTDVQRQKVDHIERAGAHLLAMLTDVLDLSRIEAGSLPMTLKPVAVAQALDEAVALVSNQAAEAHLSLRATPAQPDWLVVADHVRLRQVLLNLLSNAIKYNRPGGRVLIEAQRAEDAVVFAVTDTGRGLTPTQQAHLFEPFNRLGAERTTIEGTGIGLVIVRRLVELMNGRVDVSSTPEVGSTFRVWLPVAHVEEDAEPEGGRTTRSGFGALDDLGSRTLHVLYAEDNPVNVELVRQIMRMRPQWALEVATSGEEAITRAMTQPPDLLLLDMHLGDMTGLDVSDSLSAHPATSDIPRVALSADVMPDQIHAAQQRGFVAYLSKPLDVSRLLRLLDRCARGELVTPG